MQTRFYVCGSCSDVHNATRVRCRLPRIGTPMGAVSVVAQHVWRNQKCGDPNNLCRKLTNHLPDFAHRSSSCSEEKCRAYRTATISSSYPPTCKALVA